MPELDVLYMTRIQRERFVTAEEYANLEGNYQLTAEKMKRARRTCWCFIRCRVLMRLHRT